MSNPAPQASGFDGDETRDGIAIVGLAGRFPNARNTDEFWRNLVQGKDCITRFTDAQLSQAGYDPKQLRAIPGFVAARGLVEKPEWFDRGFFGISPREAEVMDPQHRVFLEVAWEALEDAGCDPARFSGLIGVFAGMSNNTYFPFFVAKRRDLLDAVGIVNAVVANEKDFLTTRLAYKLNLRGPALNIQTACSSSLVAVCVACQNLRDHQCDVALAGGVSLTFPQERGYFYQEGGMTSAAGECRPFDAAADGTIFSSGAGVVALKRLDDAMADGDQIYAVIKGHALNNDGGQKVSFAAPSIDGHTEVIALAQAVAGFSPETISYIEAHGTATPLGDPIEIAGLSQVFQVTGVAKQSCAVGSVKGNIGHCDAASGIASLIKTALAFRHGQLPPTLHCENPNPALHLEESPFFLNATLRSWTRSSTPRRAGVSSFGVGGTNAHVVLEEAPVDARPARQPESRPYEILVLSAKTASALEARARELADHFEENPGQPLGDAAFTLQTGRQLFQHRSAVVARTHAEAIAALRDAPKLQRVESRLDTPVAFLFSGQGAQYARMGAQLYKAFPAFREALNACVEILRPLLGQDLREILFSTEAGAAEQLRETRLTQPAIYTVSYALAKLWLSRGIRPAAMLGHSVGEFVAATIAGVFSLEDGARLVATRARLVQELPHGVMLATRIAESEARDLIAGDERLAIAAVNSPKLCVISGPAEAVEALETKFNERSVAARRLSTSHAFHSPMVEPVVAPFAEAVRAASLQAPSMPVVSSVTGDWLTTQATDPQYWANHLRATVRFSDAAGTLLRHAKFAFLETGPGQTLSQLARQHGDKTAEHEFIHSIAEDADEEQSIAAALGRLWLAGAPLDWSLIHAGEARRRVSLPTYPFERQRYFADLPVGVPLPLATAATDNEPAISPEALSLSETTSELAGASRGRVEESKTISQDTAKLDQVTVPVSPELEVLAALKSVLTELSGIDLQNAAASTGLLELGFDSLFLSQTAVSLSRKFGLKITLRQLLKDLSTLESLAAYIAAAKPISGPAAKDIVLKQVTGSSTRAEEPSRPAHGPFRPLQRELAGTLTGPQQRWLSDFVARYNARTAGSKRYARENRRQFADPRAVAGFKQAWKEIIYPIVADRSAGPHLWDIDGNEWIDLTLSFGAAMFGHQPDFVVQAITSQLARGMEIGPTSPLAGEVATLLCELTGSERATFCNTGSEAVTGAIRIARTVTGRPRIVYFRESYHGISDEVLGRVGNNGAVPIAPGIPPEALANVLILDYGDPRALEQIAASADQIAAVLVEPVQSRRPQLQPREFLHALRELTQKHGIALIFDEIISGFRCHPGGAQAYFGVSADIATYGKVIGGGLPIGAIAGRAEYLDAFDGGPWDFGDDSFPGASMTFFAGTFVRHPLALAAARAVLQRLKTDGPLLQENLAGNAARMIDGINGALVGTPFQAHRFTSNWLLQTRANFAYSGLFYALLRHHGLHIWENRPCFISTAHTAEHIDQVTKAFAQSVAELREAGFLAGGAPGQVGMVGVHDQLEAADSAVQKIPTTESQREVWLLCQQSAMANTACDVSWTLFLDGPLDAEILQSAIAKVIKRHDSLRSTFDRSGETMRISSPSAEARSVTSFTDLSSVPAAEREARFADLRAATTTRVFDLEHGPLLIVELVRLESEKHALVFNAHHLVCDGWSCDVFILELATIYSARREGRTDELPDAVPFGEYQRWETALRETPEFAADAAYWLDQYRALPPVLDLPGDRPRPERRSFRGASVEMRFPGSFAQALQKFGAEQGATLFNVLFAGFQALLYRLSGQGDLVVGIPSAGQNLAGGDHLIGHCVNMLPVRADLDRQQTFAALLRQSQTHVLEAFEHQRVTFGWLMQKLVMPRVPGRIPLMPVTFNLDPILSALQFAGLQHRLEANPPATSQFDLGFNCDQPPGEFRVICTFNTDLFEPATTRHWIELYHALLGAAIAQPEAGLGELLSNLPVLKSTVAERADASPSPVNTPSPESSSTSISNQVTSPARGELQNGAATHSNSGPQASNKEGLRPADSLGASRSFPSESGIHRLFEARVSENSTALAVEDGNCTITYDELNRRANRLARHLQSAGVATDSCVGICMERSAEFIVAALAILKLGGAYLPLDPAYPAARLALMLADTGVATVITRQPFAALVPKEVSLLDIDGLNLVSLDDSNIDGPSAGDRVAYVMFTSGSTGKPKGVSVLHRGIARLVINTDYIDLSATDAIAHVSNTAFDASTFEIWGALLNGGRVVIIDKESLLSPASLVRLVREKQVTTLFLTTPLFHHLAREIPTGFAGLRALFVGGEVLNPSVARAFLNSGAPPQRLIHVYGPTETTTFATYFPITSVPLDAERIPIGRPIANTAVYLLDEDLRVVEAGALGEICIGGPGLARGYIGSPEQTAKRFVETPMGRLYRTGDLARWLPDGALDFLGRKDQQIKLRGFRIEPAEIEAAIRRVTSVGECKVTAREVSPGERQLFAYVTRNGAPLPAAAALRHELAKVLPDFMLPAAFIEVPRFPLTANGKVAVDELPLPQTQIAEDLSLDSQNTLHSQLIEIWQEVLARQPIGIRDDFFELGGHSLLAVRMCGLVEERLGARPALSTLFEKATIEHLAASLINEQQLAGGGKPYIAIHADGKQTPFFFLHGDFVGGGFFCRGLAREIGADRPFYAIHPHGLLGDHPPQSIAVMAEQRLAVIREIRPHGPYLLGGYCNGALVAFEMARLLEESGEEVPLVILFMANGSAYRHRHWERIAGVVGALRGDEQEQRDERFLHWRRQVKFISASARHYAAAAREMFHQPFPEQTRRFAGKIRRIMGRAAHPLLEAPAELAPQERRFWDIYRDASESYVPRSFDGRLVLLWPSDEPVRDGTDPGYGWNSVSPDVQLIMVPGNHDSSITRSANLSAVGKEMRRALDSMSLQKITSPHSSQT